MWGALRGLETFSQIVYEDQNLGVYLANATYIVDSPRFPFRGFMIDTSRHFLSVPTVLEMVETLAENKMNVLHWHIVDDQSFPFESVVFPMLSLYGAWQPSTHIYTIDDVRRVIDFGRLRGVRIIPEFDTPGHTYSWGMYYTYLLTLCCTPSGIPDGTVGPINPILNTTYQFMQTFFQEVTGVYQDPYVHLGGDEVPFGCWQSNPNITAFMKKMGYGNDYTKLESYYIQNLLNIVVNQLQKRPIVWQEVFFNGVTLDKASIVDVWTGNYSDELNQVSKAGHLAILSACWYIYLTINFLLNY